MDDWPNASRWGTGTAAYKSCPRSCQLYKVYCTNSSQWSCECAFGSHPYLGLCACGMRGMRHLIFFLHMFLQLSAHAILNLLQLYCRTATGTSVHRHTCGEQAESTALRAGRRPTRSLPLYSYPTIPAPENQTLWIWASIFHRDFEAINCWLCDTLCENTIWSFWSWYSIIFSNRSSCLKDCEEIAVVEALHSQSVEHCAEENYARSEWWCNLRARDKPSAILWTNWIEMVHCRIRTTLPKSLYKDFHGLGN